MLDQTSLLPGRPKSSGQETVLSKANQSTYDRIGGSPEQLLKISAEDSRWLHNVSYNIHQSYSRNDDKSAVFYIIAFMLIGLVALFAIIFKQFEYDTARSGCQLNHVDGTNEQDSSLIHSVEENGFTMTTVHYLDLPPTYSDSTRNSSSSSTHSSSSLILRYYNDETLPPSYEEALSSALIGTSLILNEGNKRADAVQDEL